MQLLCQCD